MHLFLDCEFTELSRHASLISMAIYGDNKKYFYAELNDFDKSTLSPWVVENVMDKLEFKDHHEFFDEQQNVIKIKGSSLSVSESLKMWLNKFESIEMWGDVPHFDWVLFCDLFRGALNIPKNVHFICRDIATLFWIKEIDINIQRTEFANIKEDYKFSQHNALFDAYTIKVCYDKLITL